VVARRLASGVHARASDLRRRSRRERLITTDAAGPDWSPDGTALVFAHTQNPGLGIIGADGTGARSLTSSKDQQPAWSPDGRKIAFAHCASGTGLSCAWQIFEIAPDGTARRARTSDDAEAATLGPSWAPDSRRLAFARSREYEDEEDSHICTLSGRLTRTPPPQTPIAVHSRTGRLVARIDPGGEVVSLALGRGVAAALVRRDGSRRVEIYSPRRSTLSLGKSKAAVTLAASGRKLVVGVGRRILLFDLHSGRLALVAHASSTPVGLSLTGRRVAWAENVRRRSRVRGVTLPRF
jgi:dipeptidyl aminopeptidase/acylaminoacyl peptidase